MGRKKKGKGKSNKNIPSDNVGEDEEKFKKCPHSFVLHRGKVGKNIRDLVEDTRKVMEPYTASNLKERKNNVLKDFVSVAGLLNVTHMLAFSKTDETMNLRICRLPRGPTLLFQLQQYSLCKDIVASLKLNYSHPQQYQHHPLLVMNNFSGEGMHLKLMTTMFQNMFPSINVQQVRLKEMKRCVLLNYSAEDETIEFRHYNIRAVPVGISRAMKKLMKSKVPNISKYNDISEFLMKHKDLSESEGEMDGDHNKIILPQSLTGKGNLKSGTSAIRLTELGPRMTLKLIKIEDGINSGEVLYHAYMNKTAEEIQRMKKKKNEKQKVKDTRKKQQALNIKRKEDAKEEHKQKSLAGMKRKAKDDAVEQDDEEEEDDVKYFEDEVGERPEPELFPKKDKTKKRKMTSDGDKTKKRKVTRDGDKTKKRKVTGDGIPLKRRKTKANASQQARRNTNKKVDRNTDFDKLMKRREVKKNKMRMKRPGMKKTFRKNK